MDSIDLQRQIRNSAVEMHDSVKDLQNWLTEINQKDETLKRRKKDNLSSSDTTKNYPPVRGSAAPTDTSASKSSAGIKVIETAPSKPNSVAGSSPSTQQKNRTAAAPIKPKNYTEYNKWDSFDPDKAIEEMEAEEAQREKSSQQRSTQPQRTQQSATTTASSKTGDKTAKTEASTTTTAKKIEPIAPQTSASAEAQKLDKQNQAIALKDKGNEAFNKGNFTEAIAFYNKSLEIDPTNAVLYANRAMAYLKLKKYEETERDCTRAVSLDKTYTKAYVRRGIARRELRKFSEAITDFGAALTLEPSNKQTQTELARTREAQQQYQKQQQQQPVVEKPQKASGKKMVIEEVSTEAPASPAKPAPVSSEALGTAAKQRVSEPDDDQDVEEMVTPAAQRLAHANAAESPKQPTPKPTTTTKPQPQPQPATPQKPAEPATNTTPTKPAQPSPSQSPAAKGKGRATGFTAESLGSIPVRKVTVPSAPPKTSYEFERVFNSFKGDAELLYQYLKIIPVSSYAVIFKESFESDVFMQIIKALSLHALPNGDIELVTGILKHLPTVNRFDMTLMFLSKTEKEVVAKIFDELKEKDPQLDASLRQKFGV